MTPESAVHMIHEALMAAFWMAAPLWRLDSRWGWS